MPQYCEFRRDREPSHLSSDAGGVFPHLAIRCHVGDRTQHTTRKRAYASLANLYHQRSYSHAGGISSPKFTKNGVTSHLVRCPTRGLFVTCAWPKTDFTLRDEVGMILSFRNRNCILHLSLDIHL